MEWNVFKLCNLDKNISKKKKKKTKVLTVKGKRLSTKIDNIPEITCNGSLLTNVMNVKTVSQRIRQVKENYELSAP